LPSLSWFAVVGHTLILGLGEGKITL